MPKVDSGDYKSPPCVVSHKADITSAQAESLIGETVTSLDASEFRFNLVFTER